MNLNKRIETLEKKHLPGNGVYVINLEEGETHEHAEQRYCAENGIPVGGLDNLRPDSLIIFLDKHCSGSLSV
jgi:hypothetical protein